MILYAATSNPGKLAEFATAAQPSGITVEAIPSLATMPEPIEDAATFMGNAELKAIAYSNLAPGLLVFTDDSGLEAEALGGPLGAVPGVRSARFADDLAFDLRPNSVISTQGTLSRPPNSVISTEGTLSRRSGETPIFAPAHAKVATKDDRNNRALLTLLAALPNPTHSARFVCALALARDGNILLRAEGTVEGQLLTAPRGTDGFGYDPLFLLPSLGLTLAELPREQKWNLSHRGNAFRSLLAQLQTAAL